MAVMTLRAVEEQEMRAQNTEERSEFLRAHGLILNTRTKELISDGLTQRLTPKQYALLRLFMEHEGITLTRQYVMRHVWHTEYLGDTRTLDVHVHMLRRQLERDPHNPELLHTIRGRGYLFGEQVN